MRPKASTVLALALLLAPITARGDDTMPPAPYANRQLENPAQESKAQALMETIRCLTCQSQSIADSNASLAADLRSQIRERIKAGEQPEAIRHWLVQRYGDYITYTPRLSSLTWPLFAAPLALIGGALLLVRRRFDKGLNA